MKTGKLLRPLEAAVLAVLFALAFRFPGALGGWLEPVMALALPMLASTAFAVDYNQTFVLTGGGPSNALGPGDHPWTAPRQSRPRRT